MSGFTDPFFLLFAGLAWIGTVIWSFIVFVVLMSIFTQEQQEKLLFETGYSVSLLPFIAIWLYFAPQIAGYGIVLFTVEGVIGLGISVVLILLGLYLAVGREARKNPTRFA